jgi:hypothetical protein
MAGIAFSIELATTLRGARKRPLFLGTERIEGFLAICRHGGGSFDLAEIMLEGIIPTSLQKLPRTKANMYSQAK